MNLVDDLPPIAISEYSSTIKLPSCPAADRENVDSSLERSKVMQLHDDVFWRTPVQR